MTGRYPCNTICPECKTKVQFFLGAIHGSGKKCPKCGIKLIHIQSSWPYTNDDLIKNRIRVIREFEKEYYSNDGVGGIEYPRVCPHGLLRYEKYEEITQSNHSLLV